MRYQFKTVGDKVITVRYDGIWKDSIELARSLGATVIYNHRQFARVSHKLTAPKGQIFSVMSLNEDPDKGVFIPMSVQVPVGLEAEPLEKYIHPENVHINDVYMNRVERFTRAYLNLRVENPATLNLLLMDGHLLVVTRDGANGSVVAEGFYVLGPEEGKVINLCTAEVQSEAVVAKAASHVYVYGLNGISSPGQVKGQEISLYCESLDGFDPTKHLNDMTHGMYWMLLEYYRGKAFEKLKILAQISTRMSQFKAPMVKLPGVSGLAVTLSKWEDTTGNLWADGLQIFAAEEMARCLSDEHFLVLPSAVDGYAAQARINIVNKGLGHVTPRFCMLAKMRAVKIHAKEGWIKNEIFFKAQDEWNEEDEQNYKDAVLENRGPWYNKTVVILPTFVKEDGTRMTRREMFAQIGAWVDLNVHKSVCDFKRPLSGFNIMSLSHAKDSVEDEANSSNQLLASALFADPFRTVDYVVGAAKEEACRVMTQALKGEARQLGARELMGDLAMASQSVNPEFARKQWAPFFQDNLNKALEGFGNRLAKLQIKTDGIYLKILPDLSHFFGCDLLRYDDKTGICEVFAPQMNREGYTRGIGIKYPKMAFDEFGKFVFVDAETLIDRAYGYLCNGKITAIQFAVIAHELRHLHDGIVMVPAIEELKDMLAGMDFDGDALVMYCDPEFVDIIWAIKPVATSIKTNEEYAALAEKLQKDAATA
jgi:hypothetical protein